MSERSKSCPNCLSISILEIGPHEFECRACGNQFSFDKPKESITTEDVKGRYCPFCGTSTSGGLGHKCTGCNRVDFCNNCVHRSPNKLFCNECLIKNKKNCLACGTYAVYYCKSCQNIEKQTENENYRVIRACLNHENLFYDGTFVDKDTGRSVAVVYSCPNCGGVCPHCIMEESKFLSKKLVCRFCNSKLKESKRWAQN